MDFQQTGDHSQNIQISNSGHGNTYQFAPPPDTPNLKVDQNTVRTFDKSLLEEERLLGTIKFLAGITVGMIGVVADLLELSSRVGFSLQWLLPVGAFVGFVAAMPHRYSSKLLSLVNGNPKGASYIGKGEVVEDNHNGTISVYKRATRCTYPNCDGHIVLHDAPPRETARLGKAYVGICDVAGTDHSYWIDYVWNAFKRRFDWRPLDQSQDKKPE